MKMTLWRGSVFCLSALLAFAVASAGDLTTAQGMGAAKRIGPQTSTKGVTVEDYFARQTDLHSWLMGQTPAGTLANPISVKLTQAELLDVDTIDNSGPGPMRVGLVKQPEDPVNLNCENVGRRQRHATCTGDGVFKMTKDGGFVWARSVTSPGAFGIRVHLTEFSLPPNADLYFFNLDGEAYGPFQNRGPNEDGDFWLPSVMSDTGIVLVRHFGPRARAELSQVSMRITDIGHIGKSFNGGQAANTRGPGDLCPYNASCIQNATCQSSGPAAVAENAVAKMLWASGCCLHLCSGGLIADTDNSSEIPYFLTANHCLSNNNAASNLEAFFQYQMPCGGSCPAGSFAPAPVSTKTLGASVVATGKKGDYSLLQLSETPPAGSTFLGWNSSSIASNNGAELHRIHHPLGAPQAYSEHAVDANIGTCQQLPRGQFIYSDNVLGAQEGGSSGSPVVNAFGEIVGQLWGWCPVGGDFNDLCNPGNHSIDGAFAFYFSNVEPFLDPAVCVPTTADCADGVDNDCDGVTDCSDTNGGAEDCSSEPACETGCVNPGGLPPGDSCSGNGDCCSNKCKGRPNNQTCR